MLTSTSLSIAQQLQQQLDDAWHLVLHCRSSCSDESYSIHLNSAVESLLSVAKTPCGPTTSLKVERVVGQAQVRVALLLCQLHRYQDAQIFITQLGYRYRLSNDVWESMPSNATQFSPYCAAWDNVLSANTLSILQNEFVLKDKYWTTHNYSDGTTKPPSTYFSYYCSLNRFVHADGESETLLHGAFGDYVRSMYKLALIKFPDVAKAKYVEFWAHHRREVMSGHQFHFDSDCEGEDGVRNPIVSTVLYLDANGGPTLVTDQLISDDTVRNEGWMVFPNENRACVFNGSVLHGVVPGNPTWPITTSAKSDTVHTRTTLMVAFWEDLSCVHKATPSNNVGTFGACMPLDFDASSSADEAWHVNLVEVQATNNHAVTDGRVDDDNSSEVAPVALKRVWADVDVETNLKDNLALSELSQLPDYSTFFQGF